MIIGIGADCCDVERIAGAIERRGDRFLARLFTDAERAAGAKRPEPATYFAGRFAAKRRARKRSDRASPNALAGMRLRS